MNAKQTVKPVLTAAVRPTANHRGFPKRIISRLGASRKLTPWILYLLCLVILNGCTKRQPTSPTPQMDIEPKFWVRVLLLDDVSGCTLKIPSSFSIVNLQQQSLQARFDRVDVPIRAKISADRISIAGWSSVGSEVVIAPDEPYVFNLNGDDYRGKLKLILNPDVNSFDAVNLVPPESYLAGVVGAEMPDYWEPAALRAQTIAARTYCWYIKKQFGGKRSWDVLKTQANQVYRGVAAESAQVWDAVNKTHGKILVCEHNNGTKDVFPAYYSSICGGHTENSQNMFGGDPFKPLTGVECPYCRDAARNKFFFWPTVQFDKSEVTKRLLKRYPTLKRLGKITNIMPVQQSNYGRFSRLTKLKLIGSTGKFDFLRAEDLRLAIDPTGRKLRSTICKITDANEDSQTQNDTQGNSDKLVFSSGRGYGHGVGMCQCGAEAMARKRKTTEQILFHYYPGSKFESIY